MRVIFMGTTPFSCVVLETLIKNGYDLVAVVTQPDRPFGRKKVLKASPVKEMALEHGIPVVQPENIRTDVDSVLQYQPDLVVTCAYGQIVPKVILDSPKYLCLNVHASLLPKYRGGAPIHWSIINGDQETGVTLMRMDPGMDSGGMLAQRSVSIEANDVMSDVEAKLMAASVPLIEQDLPRYLKGELEFVEQNPDEVTLAYTIQRKDEFVSFDRGVQDVYNHIRGLISWPVGYGILEDVNIKLHRVEMVEDEHTYDAGTIVALNDEGIHVAARGGYIIIKRLQAAGKPAVNAQDAIHGLAQDWKGKRFL